MATNAQQFIQPMAQANTPFLANNGNPNTVYNTPGTLFTNSPSPFPAPMPQNSAYNPADTQFWRNPSGVQPMTFSFENAGGVGDNVNPWTPPVTPPTTPPVGDPPPPTAPPMTGPVPGTTNTLNPGTGGFNINTFNRLTGTDPFGGWNPDSNRIGTLLRNGGQAPANTDVSVPDGSPGWMQQLGDAINSGFDGLAESLGFRDGRISVGQVLDWVLPGDLVDADTGRINWDEAAMTALNMISPGLGSMAEFLISNGVLGEQLQEWLVNMQLERQVDDAGRSITSLSNSLNSDLYDRITNQLTTVNPQLRDIPFRNPTVTVGSWGTGNVGPDLTGWGGNALTNMPDSPFNTSVNVGGVESQGIQWGDWLYADENSPFTGIGNSGGRGNTSGASVRSSTIAEGAAAQDMVGQWQLNSWLNGLADQAQRIGNATITGKGRR